MFDEKATDRWLGFEMRGIHRGLVTRKRSLQQLLQQEVPRCTTKEGEDYLFEKDVLLRFAEVTSREEREKLRLPISLYFHAEMEGQCRLDDELAGDVLRRLEGFGKAYPFRDGKMWLPYSIGLELTVKYPTAVQRLFAL